MIAVRDPHGFRPLYIGEKDGLTAVASETCALETLKITEYRQVKPGEIIVIDAEGTRNSFLPKAERTSQCIFELIYFARPDSRVFDESVHRITSYNVCYTKLLRLYSSIFHISAP